MGHPRPLFLFTYFHSIHNSFQIGLWYGQVVSVLPFYSNDPNSNPAEAYSIFFTISVWKEQKLTKNDNK